MKKNRNYWITELLKESGFECSIYRVVGYISYMHIKCPLQTDDAVIEFRITTACNTTPSSMELDNNYTITYERTLITVGTNTGEILFEWR